MEAPVFAKVLLLAVQECSETLLPSSVKQARGNNKKLRVLIDARESYEPLGESQKNRIHRARRIVAGHSYRLCCSRAALAVLSRADRSIASRYFSRNG